MKILSYMIVAVVLTACQPVVDRAVYLADETKGSFWAAVDAFEGALQYEPEPQNQPAEERHCYRARYDIVCYDEPRYEPTIGALEGSQAGREVQAQLVYQSVPAEPVNVSETTPIASVSAYDPDAPEPIGGF